MDFGTTLRTEPSTTSLSNISHIPLEIAGDDPLQKLLIEKANLAASELLGTNPETGESFSSSQFPSHFINRTETIQSGQLVVIFESFDSLTFVYATPGAVHHNKNGDFHHDDFIEKLGFGSKLRSRNYQGYGYVFLLRPTSELWARSLPHRTQIVYELDSSTVIFQLNLRPNMIVLESGTGSGAMSTAIMRTIAPYGMLHTYEFNAMRAEKAREEFKRNKIDHLVTVHHKDVCGKDTGKGGFDVGGQSAHAIFLDLPEPWLAVPHAAYAIKPNHRLCSYSPCIEQAQRCIEALKNNGFHTIKTIEVRLREHYVDEVELQMPPTSKVVRVGKDDTRVMTEEEAASFKQKKLKRGRDENMQDESNSNDGQNIMKEKVETKRAVPKTRTMVCARPFSVMKGHTAFLTFATASLTAISDPNKKKSAEENKS